jgi:hypothetical protein
MTPCRAGRYSQPAMNGLQHTGAFVVQFRTGTNFETGRVEGRVEHIASGRSRRFESMDELVLLFARITNEVENDRMAGEKQLPPPW